MVRALRQRVREFGQSHAAPTPPEEADARPRAGYALDMGDEGGFERMSA